MLLVMVAVATLSPVVAVTPQDQSRLCLSEAVLHDRLFDDACLSASFDRSSHGGHLYSDKAPGLSVLALPAVSLIRPGAPQHWSSDDLRLWAVRVLSVGLGFLLCTFLVGRVSEGLAPGFGGIALVTFALGTLVAPLSAASFEHVPAAALAFGVFVLAWRRRPRLAGLLGGVALITEYESGLILVVIGCYIALGGSRLLLRFLVGLTPGVMLLGAYDWAAFGAPWRLSYRYVANGFAAEQATGLFGIGLPRLFGITEVFAGSRGLLILSPVVVLAGLGLVWLGQTYRAEAVVAAAVTAIFVLSNSGYFDPYGGSPGPRFLVVALPFLALGLGPAFSRLPRITVIAAALSVIPTTVLTLTWSKAYVPGSGTGPGGGVWGELVRLPAGLESSGLVENLSPSALSPIGLGAVGGALLVAFCAAGAFVEAVRQMPWAEIRVKRQESSERGRPARGVIIGAVVAAYVVVAGDVLALAAYPYGKDPQPRLVDLHTSISAPSPASYQGGEVNFIVSVVDRGPVGASELVLTAQLSPGMRLVGPPAVSQGSGCTGNSVFSCGLGSLSPKAAQKATVSFGVQITRPEDQLLTSSASAQGDRQSNVASFVVSVGG